MFCKPVTWSRQIIHSSLVAHLVPHPVSPPWNGDLTFTKCLETKLHCSTFHSVEVMLGVSFYLERSYQARPLNNIGKDSFFLSHFALKPLLTASSGLSLWILGETSNAEMHVRACLEYQGVIRTTALGAVRRPNVTVLTPLISSDIIYHVLKQIWCLHYI